jgi:hypothetical protein
LHELFGTPSNGYVGGQGEDGTTVRLEFAGGALQSLLTARTDREATSLGG